MNNVRRSLETLSWLILALWLWTDKTQGQVDPDSFAWVQTGGGTLNDAGMALAVDAATNVIAVGVYSNSVTFAGTTLTNAGSRDLFVASYRGDGGLNWIQRAGGSLDDGAAGVATDSQGNSYVTGFFRGQARFQQTLLTSRGTSAALDAFLAKYNSQGGLVWVQQAGGPGDDRGYATAVDSDGGCLIAGTFNGTAIFGPNIQLTAANAQVPEAFVARYRTNGTLAWAKRFGASRGVIAYAVRVGGDGRTVFAGEFLGNAQLGTNTLVSAGDRDAFVASLNAQGDVQWATQIGGGGTDGARGLDLDPGGRVFVAGYFSDTLRWGSLSVVSAGKRDFFLAHLNSEGLPVWIQPGGGSEDDILNSVAVSSRGAVYTVGTFVGTATVAGVAVTSAGSSDVLLARFAAAGDLESLARGGGSGTAPDAGNAVAAGPGNSLFISGEFSGKATFGSLAATTSGAGNRDVFVARRLVHPPDLAFLPTNTAALLGGPFTLSVTASGAGPFSYQWYRDQVPLPGETNSTLSRLQATPADAGLYEVVVGTSESEIRTTAIEVSLEVQLTVTTQGHGQVLVDPVLARYPLGSQVQLLSLPEADSFFVRWAGDLVGTANPATIRLDGNRSVTAIFGSRHLELLTQGTGEVSASPIKDLYEPGESVQLSARAGRAYAFLSWQDGDRSNPRTIRIGESNRYTAIFTNLVPVETLAFGTVSRTAEVGMPALFVDEVFVVDGPVLRGDRVQIRFYSSFTNGILVYSLDGSLPNRRFEGPLQISQSVTIRAQAFSEDFSQSVAMDPIQLLIVPSYELHISTPGGGSVQVVPAQDRYLSNSPVQLIATSSNGWTFLGWNGDFSGSSATNQVNLQGNRCVEAIFGTTLLATNAGPGNVILDPAMESYPYGTEVRATAIPGPENSFVSWGGSISGGVNPLNFTITRTNPTLRALFLASGADFPLVVQVVGAGSAVVFPRLNSYTNGQPVILIATPEAGQEFVGWTGDVESQTNRLDLRMTRRTLLRAEFTRRPHLSIGTCVQPVRPQDLRLEVDADLGAIIQMERSLDFQSWTKWQEVTNHFGRVRLAEPSPGESSGTFQRARRVGP